MYDFCMQWECGLGDMKKEKREEKTSKSIDSTQLQEYKCFNMNIKKRAHNPEVAGSNPASATINETPVALCLQGFFV